MFRLVCLVEDKQLPNVLHALAGKVRQMETPTPVGNIAVGRDGVRQATEGSLVSLFIAHIRKKKLKEVRPADARAFLEELGRSAASTTYVLKQAVDAGALRKRGSGAKVSYAVLSTGDK
jgi:hypothetical protein